MYVTAFGRFLLEFARLTLEAGQWPDDELFLRVVYRAYLKREPDSGGREHYLTAMRHGHMRWRHVLGAISHSNEFKEVGNLPVHPLQAQHKARMMLIQDCLPPAEVIVDLGGAATDCPEGALLAMGYPHHPREIHVVDLPPTQRLDSSRGAETLQTFMTPDSVQVRYIYQSMADPLPFDNESIDLVWSGESIEHITEAEVDLVCQEVYRILKPGGCFCLDTPNASVARVLSPDALIHPEHKKEYHVHELVAKLEQQRFTIVETGGICPVPKSLQSGTYSHKELTSNIRLSDTPEECYMFFIKAIKPRTG